MTKSKNRLLGDLAGGDLADLKELNVPSNTTISAFASTVLDDSDANAARTTLGAQTQSSVLDNTCLLYTSPSPRD